MMMDAARYATGQTFEQFLRSAVKYKELWESTTRRVQIPAELLEKLALSCRGWHVVVLNEDWCMDAVSTLPPVAELVDLTEGIDLRVFGRDANLDLMDAHLTNGGRSIPMMILYDNQWIEHGTWGPRPAELQKWVLTVGVTLQSADKYREIRTWYARDHGQSVLHEFVDFVAGAEQARREAA